MTEEAGSVGRALSRRRFAAGVLAFGGSLVLLSAPGGAAQAAAPTGGNRGRVLHRGSARQAGLLPEHLRQLVSDARTYLGPSPEHPWYAGAVILAGRGHTVALHEPIGKAVRYRDYDEATDTGVEFPAEQQIPMADDTIFDLASVSKLFTSILAVQQIERGTLELEAAASSYLPEFAAAGKQDITIRQLLTHTSGFRSWIPLYEEPTREGMLQLLWDEEPESQPGTVYLYSDLNLISLQLVLERITGRPLDRLLREEITGPLGMRHTRYNPPASWKPRIAATEVARPPWSGLDRGLVWGEVHDENAHAFGGVAGHAGVFSNAWDLAVLCRTLLDGGAYGGARILRAESVELLFTDFNTAFPGDEHGLGFELYQHWYMGAMATPRTAGHTGFTGTCLVLDPSTDTFLVLLGNSVHPVRDWRSGSAPRVSAANHLARAVPVPPAHGRTAWFSGMASDTEATLTLPELTVNQQRARLSFSLWWDTEPGSDPVRLEASADGGETWQPVPFTTERGGRPPEPHPDGTARGWSGRAWHRAHADLGPWRGTPVRLRWNYTTDPLYVGRGVYVDGIRVTDGSRPLFDDERPKDARKVAADGWSASAN
ncbi:serine hydrolase domain-containing protein [Streptomyces sp. TP-A0874]|uniref:serine hydrolase domain-containing protein n=1 Tax=Streptomyces sp. TP-A0874 TaxID=549819 RepID=UPI000853B223|nr:serine hydrolase domain-containing protein [Streptomyces sp. TP-A0874]